MTALLRPGARPSALAAAVRSLPATLAYLLAALALLQTLPPGFFQSLHSGWLAFGAIGMARYLWLLTNQIRAAIYLNGVFPRLRRTERAHPTPYPQRLFVVVPSYKEDTAITERCVAALAREISLLPSWVCVVFSVSGHNEIDLIHRLMRRHGRRERLDLVFMQQAHGKRVALGQALRTVSRRYHDVYHWHEQAHSDLVVLMDGDTEVTPGVFRRTLGFFKTLPDLGALTTDEMGHMVTPEAARSAIGPWFDLKFAKRHRMMSSHALAGRVLTLTGRFSIFRADPILQPAFIRRIEHDVLNHWLFGRVRFLMGDDKSTWYDLLCQGWRMLYVPDVSVNCLEGRGGNFVRTSSQLMFRWYGNMARNNGRALGLGLQRMPPFIWLSLLDQRISMWTSLLGPVTALVGTYHYGSHILVAYMAWVVMTRTLFLWVLVPDGFVVRLLHLPLQLYDQWIGSLLKIGASFFIDRQHWAKAGHAQRQAGAQGWSLRTILAWYRLVLAALLFLFFSLLLTGVLQTPRSWHFVH
ncbi:MAG: glycosyltransferase [Hydrogenophaga sp.]|jgi:glycosyltransferase Alg8|uniref:glycosyltransferase n=1 Tax=Hydrogenophaga sp. TaxID=1904254 RepID=UPI00271A6DAA|nr:glycosyltransferase [Hydrogenophaga sp.]MDO9570954.1 glycosyltransferase [Hydrogenophaga sp.]MDP3374734.1 glycosyltransferase [Hydrogenophaga sp.]